MALKKSLILLCPLSQDGGADFFHARVTGVWLRAMERCTGMGAGLAARVGEALMRGFGTTVPTVSPRGGRALSTSMGVKPLRMRDEGSRDRAARSQAGAPA